MTVAAPITVPEAARRKRVHERTIWRWIREGAAHTHVGPDGHGFTYFTAAQFAALPARARKGPRAAQVVGAHRR